MSLGEKVKIYLDKIREIKGVENSVLAQRDGNPIQSAGVWLSKEEIFNISSATSAIYNIGIHLHNQRLKYTLIEGNSAKILLAPLKNSMYDPIDRIMIKQGIKNSNEEFFIAITALPNVNLGGIFLQTKESLKDIKRALVLSGESFKPPLRNYDASQINNLINSFNTKEGSLNQTIVNINSFSFSKNTIDKINVLFKKISQKIIDLKRISLTTSGGFLISTFTMDPVFSELDFEHEAAMSYSLFSTSNRCAWLLKKMKISSILMECDSYFQFISEIGDGILSLSINKGRQKLGLLRLLLPQYIKSLKKIVKEAKTIENPIEVFDLKTILGEICLK